MTFSKNNYLIRELEPDDEIAEDCFLALIARRAKTEVTVFVGFDNTSGCYAVHEVGEEAYFGYLCDERWSDGSLWAVECSGGFFDVRAAPSGEFVRTQTAVSRVVV